MSLTCVFLLEETSRVGSCPIAGALVTVLGDHIWLSSSKYIDASTSGNKALMLTVSWQLKIYYCQSDKDEALIFEENPQNS